MKKLLLIFAAVGALSVSAQTYTDITPAKFDFAKYEVGTLTDFWDYCINHQNHTNAINKVIALGDQVTEGGYAVFYGPTNANAYNGNLYTSIVNVDGVGNVLQFGNTNQNGNFGGCFFLPSAEQLDGTMRVTMILRGLDGGSGYNKNAGATINFRALDLPNASPSVGPISYADFHNAGENNKWYKVVIEYAPTYAAYINFAQFIWADYIQIASLKFERVSNRPEGAVNEQQIYGPADYTDFVPSDNHTVALAGSFNEWSETANVEEVTTGVAHFSIDNWTNGEWGFQFKVDDSYYKSNTGSTVTYNTLYTAALNGSNNLYLDGSAEGQTVDFTYYVDDNTFKAVWPVEVAIAGAFNSWNTEAYVSSEVSPDGSVSITIPDWTNAVDGQGEGFKVVVNGRWMGPGDDWEITEAGVDAWIYGLVKNGSRNFTLPASAEGHDVKVTYNVTTNAMYVEVIDEPEEPGVSLISHERFNFYNWSLRNEKGEKIYWIWTHEEAGAGKKNSEGWQTDGNPKLENIYAHIDSKTERELSYGFAGFYNNNRGAAHANIVNLSEIEGATISGSHHALLIPNVAGAGNFGTMYFLPFNKNSVDGWAKVTLQFRLQPNGTFGSNTPNTFDVEVFNAAGDKEVVKSYTPDYYLNTPFVVNNSGSYSINATNLNRWQQLSFNVNNLHAICLNYYRLLQLGVDIYLRAIIIEEAEAPAAAPAGPARAASTVQVANVNEKIVTVQAVEPSNITGVESVSVDAEAPALRINGRTVTFTADTEVFNAAGVRVATATASQATELTPGLYIVKGSKFVIK